MKKKKIAVIGMGSFGKILVYHLFHNYHEVVAIDSDPEIIEEVKEYSTSAVVLDATDETAMRSQGLEDMDAVVLAVADNFETLIICADILKKIGAQQIIGRYKTHLQAKILNMLGIIEIFNPEESSARTMAEQFNHIGIRSNMQLSNDYQIMEISLPPLFAEKTLMECNFREDYNLNIVTVKRIIYDKNQKRASDQKKEKVLGIPRQDMVLKAGDLLVVFGETESIHKFLEKYQ